MEYYLFTLFAKLVPLWVALFIGIGYLLFKTYRKNPLVFKQELNTNIEQINKKTLYLESEYKSLEEKYSAINEVMLNVVLKPELEAVKEKFEDKFDILKDDIKSDIKELRDENKNLFITLTNQIMEFMKK